MRKMEHAEITKEEFQELRSVFLDRTLYEGDTFYWTSPEELKTFLSFLEKNGPFDIVIDNLNLIFSQVTRPNQHGSSFQKVNLLNMLKSVLYTSVSDRPIHITYIYT